MIPMFRPGFRDGVRRRLGKIPAIDIEAGPSGEAITSQPLPANAVINAEGHETAAEVNRRANVQVSAPYTLSIAAQTADGPYRVSLDGVSFSGQDFEITSVRDAWWNDGSVNHSLWPTSREEMSRDRRQWWNQSPGSPLWWWIEGYALYLHPAPSAAITLHLVTGSALRFPETDVDPITGLASDEVPILMDIAARNIAAFYPHDAEMQARLQILAPRAEAGIQEIVRAVATRNGAQRPHFAAFSYRR